MRILIDENIPQGQSVFSGYGEVQLFAGRSLKNEDLLTADVLLVRSITRVDRSLLEKTKVRFVGTATIGVDHVDQEFLKQAGIHFVSAPGCNARSVAEYVATALLHLQAQKNFSLEGKTLGIVGFGHVGQQVAEVAPYLGLKVIQCDPPLAEKNPSNSFQTLAQLVDESDILTFHVPLNTSGPYPTRNLINATFFESWKHSKVLLNTSRGEILDEKAFLLAHKQGLIKHCVLDVFPSEPGFNPELAVADLITPHIAGYSLRGKLNGTAMMLKEFCRYFDLPQQNHVLFPTPENSEIPFPEGPLRYQKWGDYLYHFATKSYAIVKDDLELRQSLQKAHPEKEFDRLRRQYPIRHEFAGFQISSLPASETLLGNRLAGLGFRVKREDRGN